MCTGSKGGREVRSHPPVRLGILCKTVDAGRVLVTVGFNPAGDGRGGAMVARFGTGTKDWPAEDRRRQRIEDRDPNVVVLTRFDSLDQFWDHGVGEVQRNLKTMLEGFDMDKYRDMTKQEIEDLTAQVSKGSGEGSKLVRQTMIKLATPDEVAAVASPETKKLGRQR
jgi:hypothetical protein